ncbi:hypothetical protein N7533_011432 [Penicillium manginii]|uniref:uncharacterized protein n=1 Tax=Penicillium manginii TaxID=203109 RepID=UPI00254881ED|nr:uncharacterized protein N7533_011432 [Penicillium manginii]KAJ5742023.1 hypothetical protein N7533_011432 [Penicillium manginii]
MVANALRNIVVVGGSFVGRGTAQELAKIIPPTHRVLLTEPHSHFHHLFTFPRFAIVPGQEHKAFIPYSEIFSGAPNPAAHGVVQARVVSVNSQHIELDREWQGSKQIPFDYVVLATGTRLSKPAAMDSDEKLPSVEYLQKHQADVKRSKSILIVGGGAVGVQMATDLKEYYPEKNVTVVQSRLRVMPSFHPQLHDLVKQRFDELESTELVILATGQTPNNQMVSGLTPSTPDGPSVINPDNGYLRIRPTMQLLDEKYSNIFAVGDIADTGAQKAARPGSAQAAVVAKNILSLIEGKNAEDTFVKGPGAIHLTLGMVSSLVQWIIRFKFVHHSADTSLSQKHNVIFRNPNTAEGATEPVIMDKQDGQEDMNVEAMWGRLGITVDNARQYHL